MAIADIYEIRGEPTKAAETYDRIIDLLEKIRSSWKAPEDDQAEKKHPGRERCDRLRAIRRKIAEANNVDFHPDECHHRGPCSGTCPAMKTGLVSPLLISSSKHFFIAADEARTLARHPAVLPCFHGKSSSVLST